MDNKNRQINKAIVRPINQNASTDQNVRKEINNFKETKISLSRKVDSSTNQSECFQNQDIRP